MLKEDIKDKNYMIKNISVVSTSGFQKNQAELIKRSLIDYELEHSSSQVQCDISDPSCGHDFKSASGTINAIGENYVVSHESEVCDLNNQEKQSIQTLSHVKDKSHVFHKQKDFDHDPYL